MQKSENRANYYVRILRSPETEFFFVQEIYHVTGLLFYDIDTAVNVVDDVVVDVDVGDDV